MDVKNELIEFKVSSKLSDGDDDDVGVVSTIFETTCEGALSVGCIS